MTELGNESRRRAEWRGLIRARPQSGEWHFAGSPLLDGQYIDGVVVAGDGSVWVSLEYESSVYRCE